MACLIQSDANTANLAVALLAVHILVAENDGKLRSVGVQLNQTWRLRRPFLWSVTWRYAGAERGVFALD